MNGTAAADAMTISRSGLFATFKSAGITVLLQSVEVTDALIVNGADGADAINAASVALNMPLTLNGGNGADVITASPFPDVLNGDAGDDVIMAGDGADTIDGGADTDYCDGGPGIDLGSNCETSVNIP